MAEALRCTLCHHRCLIPPGGRGFCGTRENGASGEAVFPGGLSLPYYGYVTAAALDPIEKKPLYHFRPGSRILSLGFAGCNLRCPFCQNWRISQLRGPAPEGRKLRPGDAIALALEDAPPASHSAAAFPMGQIAYTYSEPLIHFEFLKDCMELAHEQGIANVLVSNGCINLEMAEKILPLIDAANIDLKCFSAKTYREVLGGDLETVLNFIRAARGGGVRLELTTLVVPGLNDSEAEIERCGEFIAALEGENAAAEGPIPWHLSAYHPSYRWDTPPTDLAALLRLAGRARKLLPYVYTGNIPGEENDTPCPRCGAVLVRRRGYRVESRVIPGVEPAAPSAGTNPALNGPRSRGSRPCRCPSCGAEAPVYW
ncbi:MAG: AmmeMemoRadiSam system radical SAM enzyme [Treponema sp.]|jgi:pyruvate formate lyase activating enzyme|nr:AmmeMemoRadiSam system radical SAM enzyme [Treponema sp.]